MPNITFACEFFDTSLKFCNVFFFLNCVSWIPRRPNLLSEKKRQCQISYFIIFQARKIFLFISDFYCVTTLFLLDCVSWIPEGRELTPCKLYGNYLISFDFSIQIIKKFVVCLKHLNT